MSEYLLYFTVTLVFSTLFAMGGVGSAIALVSIFPMLGSTTDISKALALFVNTSSMITTSIMNFKRGVLDFKFTMPLVISVVISSPIGALLSQYINHILLQWILVIFLLTSASLLLFKKRKTAIIYNKIWILYSVGSLVGLLSGMLGIGGGSLIMPLLILLGFDAKKSAYGVSFVIPFSTLGAFLTYVQFIQIDWILLGVVTISALIGGYLGGAIMHYKLSQTQIKKVIAIVLYLIAFKIILTLV